MLLLASSAAVGAPTPTSVHFTAVGDYAATSNTAAVLDGIDAVAPDAHFALGDLSYGAPGGEETWCSFVKGRTGEGFPFELLAGNHESNGQDGNINDFSACLPNQLPGLVGTYGRQYYVDIPQQDPLVRYIGISPDLTFPDGTWRYDAGTARYNWTAEAIDGARDRGAEWVVVAMHKPCLTTGIYNCSSGPDLANMLLARKVDLVLAGHEHLYQRTKQLRLDGDCPGLLVNAYDADCVVDSGDALVAGAGTVFVTLGTGGISLRAHDDADPVAPYFASVMASNRSPTYGFGEFDVTPDVLAYSFRPVGAGGFTDAFTLTRGAQPQNQSPVAAFERTVTGRDVAFDATGSYDTDGRIDTYSWDFGDGTTGVGVSPNHTYEADDTYSVTLTVVDEEGATDSVTRPVAVDLSGPTVLAADDFERVVTNGWGQADVGGTWFTSGRSGEHGVSDGLGRITMSVPGRGPRSVLQSMTTTDMEMEFDLTLDTMPTGRVDHSVVMREVNGHRYLGIVRIYPNGQIRVNLRSRIVGGANSSLSPTLVVPGAPYTAGTTLRVKAAATGTSPTQLRLKVWRATEEEPSDWTLTGSGNEGALQRDGSVGVLSYLSSSASSGGVSVLYDAFRVVATQ